MSAKILAGITHAIVTIPEKTAALETGVRAVVDLCYGPGDDTAICGITLVLSDDELVWTIPHMTTPSHGHKIMKPVFRGQLLIKLCEAGARAVDHIKRDLGVPKYDTRYRVFTEGTQVKAVEEIAA